MKKLLLLMLFCSQANAAGWECIGRTVLCHTWRMATPTGWIVSGDNSAGGGEHGYAMTFVPDPNHTWNV